MPELKDIVPARTLCRQIPKGDFADSALIWMRDGNIWFVNAREFDVTPDAEYPAPTLQEILHDLPRATPDWSFNNADEALSAWLEMRG